jgi:hypothetical protein
MASTVLAPREFISEAAPFLPRHCIWLLVGSGALPRIVVGSVIIVVVAFGEAHIAAVNGGGARFAR